MPLMAERSDGVDGSDFRAIREVGTRVLKMAAAQNWPHPVQLADGLRHDA